MQNKGIIKLGIYGSALMLMGVIGVAGCLSVIGEHFADASQTTIMNIIAIPCLVVIPVTIIVGKLMDVFSKKRLAQISLLIFAVAGWAPSLMDSIVPILVMRGVFGIGVGMVQVVTFALVAEYFEGAEREKVQGTAVAAQMLGCAIMVFAGGWLGALSWELGFYVHLLAILSFFLVTICIPNTKPVRQQAASGQSAPKGSLTGLAWFWCVTMLVFMIGGQIYSNYLSFLISDHNLGTAADSGTALAFFCIGGVLMGVFFGKLASITKKATLGLGFLALAASYLLIAYAGSMTVVFAGCLLCGLAFSVVLPCIFVGTANSVSPVMAGFAISLATCAQNLGQFLSPFVTAPLSNLLGGGQHTSLWAFNSGAGLLLAFGVIFLLGSLRRDAKAVKA